MRGGRTFSSIGGVDTFSVDGEISTGLPDELGDCIDKGIDRGNPKLEESIGASSRLRIESTCLRTVTPSLRGHVFGKINVIVTLRAGPPLLTSWILLANF